jgi:hypothetical protein
VDTNEARDNSLCVKVCTCQKVKTDYMKPGGLLQPLSIPDWKWDDIMGLPLTSHKFDSIWVIMDQLTKLAHFIPVSTKY